MHYLSQLAGKLVASYQDRENLSLWISSNHDQSNQQALVAALRSVLEQEVADGRLRYDCLHVEMPESSGVLLKVS